MIKLTNSEKEVLDTLWKEGEPLTATEIVQKCTEKNWKPSYIHIMVNSLLKKEMIKVAEFKQTTKNYARAYVPTMPEEEWCANQLMDSMKKPEDILGVVKEMLDDINDLEELDKLQKLIDQKRNSDYR